MISENQLPELGVYRRLEGQLPVEKLPEMGSLVVPSANDQLPVHRWFRFKEGFSADLLKALLTLLGIGDGTPLSICDPFCGVGTTLVSAQELSPYVKISAFGIERNPFLHFVANTKVAWPLMDADQILALGKGVLDRVGRGGGRVPRLSSLASGRCMSRYISQRLTTIRDAIRKDGDSPNHDALMLGLASVVEQLSKTRKDGRALRLVTKGHPNIVRALSARWQQIASDVRIMQHILPRAKAQAVILGDGRNPTKHGIPPCSVDLLVTSPPYPNNIDYSEVYKLELWLLGFISDSDEFLRLRKTTFRSHPTAAPAPSSEEFSHELRKGMLRSVLGPIIHRTRSSPEQYRKRLIIGYASDLWAALREQYRLLKRSGLSAVVVGNSLHGGKHAPYLIPTDLIVSAIAERTGFTVKKLAIARNFRRRLTGNHFLRESIILLQKE